MLQESFQINTELDDWETVAGTLHQLAWVVAKEGDLEEARKVCEQSIAILNEIGSPFIEIAQESLGKFSQTDLRTQG